MEGWTYIHFVVCLNFLSFTSWFELNVLALSKAAAVQCNIFEDRLRKKIG